MGLDEIGRRAILPELIRAIFGNMDSFSVRTRVWLRRWPRALGIGVGSIRRNVGGHSGPWNSYRSPVFRLRVPTHRQRRLL
jgi:hypothetical protein